MNLVRCCSFAADCAEAPPGPPRFRGLAADFGQPAEPPPRSRRLPLPGCRNALAATPPDVLPETLGGWQPGSERLQTPTRSSTIAKPMQRRVGHRSAETGPPPTWFRCHAVANINTARKGAQSLAAALLSAGPIKAQSPAWKPAHGGLPPASPATRLRLVVAPNDCLSADRTPNRRGTVMSVVGRGDLAICLRPAPFAAPRGWVAHPIVNRRGFSSNRSEIDSIAFHPPCNEKRLTNKAGFGIAGMGLADAGGGE